MALSDYAHWNEDAPRIWWEEEGRHVESPDDMYPEPTGAELDYEDAYDSGYYAAENGEQADPPDKRRLRDAYLQGYSDGSHTVEPDDHDYLNPIDQGMYDDDPSPYSGTYSEE
jgi:hypothetical protein